MLRKILWGDLYAVLGAAATIAARPPSGPQLGRGPSPTSGPSPFLVLGVAFAAGIVLAKWIAWRGHAHPSG